jgi:hypothetical protein
MRTGQTRQYRVRTDQVDQDSSSGRATALESIGAVCKIVIRLGLVIWFDSDGSRCQLGEEGEVKGGGPGAKARTHAS